MSINWEEISNTFNVAPGEHYCDAYGFIYRSTSSSPIDFIEDKKYITENLLQAFKITSINLLKEFINQSLKETEISIALAQKNNDKDQYNWWCGFVEALNEMMAKIEEIESNE